MTVFLLLLKARFPLDGILKHCNSVWKSRNEFGGEPIKTLEINLQTIQF